MRKGFTPLEISNLRMKLRKVRNHKFRTGFTLMELLIVIAIMVILGTVSVVTLSNVKQSRQVKVVADEIKDKLIEARSYAVAPSNGSIESVQYVQFVFTKRVGNSNAKIITKETDGNGNRVTGGLNNIRELPGNIDFNFAGEGSNAPTDLDNNSTYTIWIDAQNLSAYLGEIVQPNGSTPLDYTAVIIVKNTSGTEKYKLAINRFVVGDIEKITPEPVEPSSDKDITAFKLKQGESEVGVGNITNNNIAVTVPFGTDTTNLIPEITITGVSVNPSSGEAKDFNALREYIVTAEDNSTKEYVVTVTVEAPDSGTIGEKVHNLLIAAKQCENGGGTVNDSGAGEAWKPNPSPDYFYYYSSTSDGFICSNQALTTAKYEALTSFPYWQYFYYYDWNTVGVDKKGLAVLFCHNPEQDCNELLSGGQSEWYDCETKNLECIYNKDY